jgi:hypothetical protein
MPVVPVFMELTGMPLAGSRLRDRHRRDEERHCDQHGQQSPHTAPQMTDPGHAAILLPSTEPTIEHIEQGGDA